MKNRFRFPYFRWPLNPPLKQLGMDGDKSNSVSGSGSSIFPNLKKEIPFPSETADKNFRRRRARVKKTNRLPPSWPKGGRFKMP
jgi:hypothetical protein